jgi:hypothetical protein
VIYDFTYATAELYDLESDPGEKRDIAASHPDLVREWVEEIRTWAASIELTYRANTKRALEEFVSRTPPAKIHTPLRLRIGDHVELLGYRSPEQIPPRKSFSIGFFMHVLKEIPAGHRIRLRGSGVGGDEVVFDHTPVRGLYPFERWQVGEYIHDVQTAKGPLAWSTRAMDLCLEMLDPMGRHVPITDEAGRQEDCYPLETVYVGRMRERLRAERARRAE